jgi:hypothetical protein
MDTGFGLCHRERCVRLCVQGDVITSTYGIRGIHFDLEWERAPLVTCLHWTNLETLYRLAFPLDELANAVALCGWTLLNELPKTPALEAKLREVQALGDLEIPDGRVWFSRHARRAN